MRIMVLEKYYKYIPIAIGSLIMAGLSISSIDSTVYVFIGIGYLFILAGWGRIYLSPFYVYCKDRFIINPPILYTFYSIIAYYIYGVLIFVAVATFLKCCINLFQVCSMQSLLGMTPFLGCSLVITGIVFSVLFKKVDDIINKTESDHDSLNRKLNEIR